MLRNHSENSFHGQEPRGKTQNPPKWGMKQSWSVGNLSSICPRPEVPNVIPSLETMVKHALNSISYRRRFHRNQANRKSSNTELAITQSDIVREIRKNFPLVDEWYSENACVFGWIKNIPMALLLIRIDDSKNDSNFTQYESGVELLKQFQSQATHQNVQGARGKILNSVSLPSLNNPDNCVLDRKYSEYYSSGRRSADENRNPCDKISREEFEVRKRNCVNVHMEAMHVIKGFWSSGAYMDASVSKKSRQSTKNSQENEKNSKDRSSELRRLVLCIDESGRAVVRVLEPISQNSDEFNHRGTGVGMKRLSSTRMKTIMGGW